ncbi:hypothetical protein PBI_SCTP2_502 [Salicola phage SCTP-2]|nr:hypothetical protein PBI_SCTP2_502 [Salicola phage SCTP-2]
MKKDEICMYKVEIVENFTNKTSIFGKEYSGYNSVGKLTNKNIFERLVKPYVDSMKEGGVNAHVSREIGYIPYPKYVKVTVQKGSRCGEVIEWEAPMFMVW